MPRERGIARARRKRYRRVERLAHNLRCPSRHITDVLERGAHVDRTSNIDRLALVKGLQLREFLGMRLQHIGETQQDSLAVRGPQPAPHARFERGASAGDGSVHIGCVGIRNCGQHIARRGIEYVRPARRMCWANGAVDEKAVFPCDKGMDRIAQDDFRITGHIVALSTLG